MSYCVTRRFIYTYKKLQSGFFSFVVENNKESEKFYCEICPLCYYIGIINSFSDYHRDRGFKACLR